MDLNQNLLDFCVAFLHLLIRIGNKKWDLKLKKKWWKRNENATFFAKSPALCVVAACMGFFLSIFFPKKEINFGENDDDLL